MIRDEVFNKCTRCGKEFTDLKVSVELGLFVERLRDTGVWEDVPNMSQESREFLCPDCFNKLCDILAQMNLPQTTGTNNNDHGVILPVEERVDNNCECQKQENKCECEDQTQSVPRHRHNFYEEDDDDMIEYVISSKIMENGVEVPGPDDGKVVRVSRKEWEEKQKAEQNKSRPEDRREQPHHFEEDMLVDVCDDIIYG